MKNNKSIFKTDAFLYIQAIVYILILILVVFFSITSNIYVKILPFLFILGAFGNIIFGRTITTTIFSYIVSICIYHLEGVDLLPNFVYSLIIALQVCLGELLGEYIKKIYSIIKKEKVKSIKKANKDILMLFVIFIFCIIVSYYANGDFVTLQKSKNAINNYLKNNNIDVNNIKIYNITYSFANSRKYTFYIKDKTLNENFKYSVYVQDKYMVVNEYNEYEDAKNNKKLKQEIQKYMMDNNIMEKYQDIDIEVITQNDEITLELTKYVNSIENEIETFAKEVESYLNDIKEFEGYNKIQNFQIVLKNINDNNDIVSSCINKKSYEENISIDSGYVYILKSLNVEFID